MKLFHLPFVQYLFGPLVFLSIFSCATAALAAHPLITDDAGTSGKGKGQVELTGEYGHDKETGVTSKASEVAASFTYGLTDSLDLVAGIPYIHQRSRNDESSSTEHGLSDISLEMKWRFYEHEDLSLAIKPGLSLPTGDEEKGLGVGKATYSLFFIASKEMTHWAVHLNLGYVRNENTLDEEKNLLHGSIASSLAISENLTAVANIGIESNSDKPAGTDPAFILGGLVYALSENVDLDCGLKYWLNEPETDYTLLAGITWKF